MTIPTKAWLYLCAAIIYTAAAWYHGYHTSDSAWQLKGAKRQKDAADAAAKLSKEYRKKEQANATEWAAKETQYINQAGEDERDYRDTIARIRAGNGVRVKRELTCGVPGSASTSSSGDDQAQGGLSAEVAERVIGIGAECDQVVTSLDACQAYVELLLKDNKKPLD